MEGALTLSWRDMGRTAGILCAASLVGLLFYKAGITEANIVTVYLLAVLCTALATDGRVYGISAAVASVLVFNYLFTVPRFTLKFNDVSRYSVTFLVMFIAACITSTLTMLYFGAQPEAQAFYEKNGCPRGLTAYTIPKDHR